MVKGLVSVITPMYNSEKTISRTIESVINQSYNKWEMIIVDDGSSDKSADVVKEYCKRESRILFFQNEEKKGVSYARNRAINMSRGQYIAFLDSDDWWKAEKIEKQIACFGDNECAIVYSECVVVNEKGRETGKIRYVPENITYRELLKGNVIPCLTVVIDRKRIKNGKQDRVKMKDVGHEDYALWLELLREGNVAKGIKEPLAYYRETSSSLSGNKLKSMIWNWKILYKEEKLGVFRSCFYMVNYIFKSIIKRF